MNNLNIFVYTKAKCFNCVAVKQLLKSKGLKFIENDMDTESVRQAFHFAYPDVKQLPQIFINDRRVGGLAGLQQALKDLGL